MPKKAEMPISKKNMPMKEMPKTGHMPMHKDMHKGTGKKGK